MAHRREHPTRRDAVRADERHDSGARLLVRLMSALARRVVSGALHRVGLRRCDEDDVTTLRGFIRRTAAPATKNAPRTLSIMSSYWAAVMRRSRLPSRCRGSPPRDRARRAGSRRIDRRSPSSQRSRSAEMATAPSEQRSRRRQAAPAQSNLKWTATSAPARERDRGSRADALAGPGDEDADQRGRSSSRLLAEVLEVESALAGLGTDWRW